MPNPLDFLLGTLSGIRGSFARFFRGRPIPPSVSTLARGLRNRIQGITIEHARRVAQKLLESKSAADQINTLTGGQTLPKSEIPRAPLYDVPSAQQGDVISEVLIETRATDSAEQTRTNKFTEIIVISDEPSPEILEAFVVEAANNDNRSPLGVFQEVVVSSQVLWTFVVGE